MLVRGEASDGVPPGGASPQPPQPSTDSPLCRVLQQQLVMAGSEHAKMMPRSPGGPAPPRKPVDTACCGASFLAEFFHMFNLVFLVSVASAVGPSLPSERARSGAARSAR